MNTDSRHPDHREGSPLSGTMPLPEIPHDDRDDVKLMFDMMGIRC